ncbi:MAG TPA: hypothetical protein VFE84_01225 [Patescibacteria group bacterium]|nr:hypothetical protein [Patescibacteria group bacterium]
MKLSPTVILILSALSGFSPIAEAATAPAPAPEPAQTRLRIQTDFSYTANLVHWVDNLAGTSVGKTMFFHQRYWEERFGPMDGEDRRALEEFARIRRLPVPAIGRAVVNESGCLPVESEGLGWNQLFLAEAMGAGSLEDFRRRMATHLDEQDVARLMASIDRFGPRFERVWKDLSYVKRFDARFRRYLGEDSLPRYLAGLAGFFGVAPGPDRPMKISFIGLPSDGPTHAEADGDYLLIEIRPTDSPRDQVEVVSHEASHFLMRLMSADQVDKLARQSFGEGEAGPIFWRYVWEGLPTALGQGVAQAKLSPENFSLARPWYHLETIDRFAKLIYPAVAQAIAASRPIDDGLVAVMTRILGVSPLVREAHVADFLMTAFYLAGEGQAPHLDALRQRLGPGSGRTLALDDPAAADILRRYVCLPGMMLVGPSELARAAALDGAPLLSDELVSQSIERSSRGLGVIVVGRRASGAPVVFVVAPKTGPVGPTLEALTRLRGLPDRQIVIIGGTGATDENLGKP